MRVGYTTWGEMDGSWAHRHEKIQKRRIQTGECMFPFLPLQNIIMVPREELEERASLVNSVDVPLSACINGRPPSFHPSTLVLFGNIRKSGRASQAPYSKTQAQAQASNPP